MMKKVKARFIEFFKSISENLFYFSDLNLKSLRGKIILMSFVPLLIMFSIAIVVLFQVQGLTANLSSVIKETVPAITTSKDMTSDLVAMEAALFGAIHSQGNSDQYNEFFNKYEDSISRFESSLERYANYKVPEKAVVLRGKVFEVWKKKIILLNEAKVFMDAEKIPELQSIFTDKIKPTIAEMRDVLSNIELNNTDIIETEENKSEKGFDRNKLIFGASALVLGCLGVSVVLSGKLSRELNALTVNLYKEAETTKQQSILVLSSSESLSESSNHSASAIQETSTAVKEIKRMSERSSKSTDRSAEVAKESVEFVELSEKSLKNVQVSFDEIDKSSIEMTSVAAENNRNAGEILTVIEMIAAKTQMINEIVFQTKLLSFNASVEAARAGEHGKGFAVVAEEIGSLAKNSGNAADEITLLLNESRQKIKNIVDISATSTDEVVKIIQLKVEESKKYLEESISELGNIVGKSREAEELASTILVSTQEQENGLGEITTSLNKLGQLSQKNLQDGKNLGESSERLLEQANSLGIIVNSLQKIVKGT